MTFWDKSIAPWIVAIGIGLLIGAERERRKGQGPQRSPAGVRTFAIASLLGATASTVGENLLLAVVVAGVICFVSLAYFRSATDDPGLTTEIALVATVVLGAHAMRDPATAAAIAVVIATLLALRAPMHRFVRETITASEGKAALIFAAATLVILPILPDRHLGPFSAINPRSVWMLVIVMLAVGVAGHIAVRFLGAQAGLPLAGFASGFVSSSATIVSMGARSQEDRQFLEPAVAGAVLSTIASLVLVAIVVALTDFGTATALAMPLGFALGTSVAYGLYFALPLRSTVDRQPTVDSEAISLRAALAMAAVLTLALLLAAALRSWLGERGVLLGAAIAGLVDVHATAISATSQVAAGETTASTATFAVLAGLTANTLTKTVLAATTGTSAFAKRVIPGLILVLLAAWFGAFVGSR